MNRKMVFVLIVNLLLSVSVYFLITIVTKKKSDLDQTSKLRFQCFIGVHVLFFISMLILIKIEHLYTYIVFGLVNCLLTVTSLSICQKRVETIQSDSHYNPYKYSGTFQRHELTYLNIYFLIFMYSIIGLIVFSLFLIITESLICYQEYQINNNIERCLLHRQFTSDLQGKDCSICLEEFHESGDSLVEVKICGHLFHEKCLIEWIVRNKTCPLDRKEIFDFQLQDQNQV